MDKKIDRKTNSKIDNSRRPGICFYIWLLATLACMIMIFVFSSMDGEASREVSDGTLYRILMVFGGVLPQKFILWFTMWIRKVAHFVAYMLLGFCATEMWYHHGSKRTEEDRQTKRSCAAYSPVYGQLTASLYACSDELHQLFVPGRAGMVMDVLLDSGGALSGVIAALGFNWLLRIWTRREAE